jgi:hypothetical protein
MKTTLELSDHILNRAKAVSRQRGVTLRGLVEEGLTRVLDEQGQHGGRKVVPVTMKGNGLSPEYAGASWGQVRDAIYEERGA